MAINIPHVSTNVETPLPSNASKDLLLKMLLQGQQAGLEHGSKTSENIQANDLKTKASKEDFNALMKANDEGKIPEGAGAKLGDASFTRPTDPLAHGVKEGKDFVGGADKSYKMINDQLDSGKATLDNLNLGNSTGDKLALINEAKLSLAGSGGRAVGQMVALLSGDSTMAGDAQKAINWLQNTPNIPTLQPAQRDAIRESVFARLPQISDQHKEASAKLAQQGPLVAPHADYATLAKSITEPAQVKLAALQQMGQEYAAQRAGAKNPISSPSIANPNPTTLDRIKEGGLTGFLKSFMPGNTPAAPQAGPAPASMAPPSQGLPFGPQSTQQKPVAPLDPIAAELARRAAGGQ